MLFGSPSGVGEERDDIVEDTARAVTGAEIDVDVEAEAAVEDGATALEKTGTRRWWCEVGGMT